MTFALAVTAALLLDRLLGEPRRWHPLAGFGRLAQWLEARLYGMAPATPAGRRIRGVAAVAILLAPLVWLVSLLAAPPVAGSAAAILALYFAVGQRSLAEHAARVEAALQNGDLDGARSQAAMLVSRDTQAMQPADVARATVESVLENGNDAVFGALFWFLAAGAPGAVLYRLSNTLDAMWGYRNPRYRYFGWAAARLDDLLNFVPARLTALTYALLGRTGLSLACWRRQARLWESPNAGPVMAAGAGSLGVSLGGPASYQGRIEARPLLGAGQEAAPGDIARARALVRRGVWLWLALIWIGGLCLAWIGGQPLA